MGYKGFNPREFFRNFIQEYEGIKYIEADEDSKVWRHACMQTGVSVIKPVVVPLGDGRGIKFHYCRFCRTLVYIIV